ncbi:MAG: hypothetical protein M3Y45_05310 [Actinomycetota bacterium]|nr:hypothetical protein [Actinomycetota bacterium]
MVPVTGTLGLKPTEERVLRLMVRGVRQERIAEHLGLNFGTVRRAASTAYQALGISAHATPAIAAAYLLALDDIKHGTVMDIDNIR